MRLVAAFVVLALAGCAHGPLGVTSAYVRSTTTNARSDRASDQPLEVRTSQCALGRAQREAILQAALTSSPAPEYSSPPLAGDPSPRSYLVTFVRRGKPSINAIFAPQSSLMMFNGRLRKMSPGARAAVAGAIARSGCVAS